MKFTIFIFVITLVLGGLQYLFLVVFTPRWRKERWARRVAIGMPVAAFAATLFWYLLRIFDLDVLAGRFLVVPAGLSMGLLALFLAWPVAGLLHLTDFSAGWLHKRVARSPNDQTGIPDSLVAANSARDSAQDCAGAVDISRRRFLQKTAVGVPALSVAAAGFGMVSSYDDVRIFEMPLHFSNLPAGLEGFRILHLCDSHIGYAFQLSHLETLVRKLEGQRIDLIVAVGDIADDLSQLGDALELIAGLRPTYGVYGSLGNHEYYRGIRAVRRIYDRSPVPLLVNDGRAFNVNGSRLFLGAANDPVGMSLQEDRSAFYEECVSKSFRDSQSGDFTLFMTHRPGAFDIAAQRKIDLSLAGHTHGGQFGLFGRSAFEMFGDTNYLWGHYQKEASQLYTSCGVGQWFPFRLGCPAEAPIFTLHRGVENNA